MNKPSMKTQTFEFLVVSFFGGVGTRGRYIVFGAELRSSDWTLGTNKHVALFWWTVPFSPSYYSSEKSWNDLKSLRLKLWCPVLFQSRVGGVRWASGGGRRRRWDQDQNQLLVLSLSSHKLTLWFSRVLQDITSKNEWRRAEKRDVLVEHRDHVSSRSTWCTTGTF